jgi:hypothetical protein
MLKLQIIIGSTRSERNADPVCCWFEHITRSHGTFAVETVDLRSMQDFTVRR